MKNRMLVLEDGTVLKGRAFGSEKDAFGEVVFNTGMTGYQETITDPSYSGQIITFTYPLIGNYGINRDDFESIEPVVKGVIVKEAAEFASNWRQQETLDTFLKAKGIPGISGIDTRFLTRLIREHGTLKGVIANSDQSVEEMVNRAKASKLPTDQIRQVSPSKAYPSPGSGRRVVLIDFGMKHSILRELNSRLCDVIVMPYDTTAEQIRLLHPDGVMLSNGPGNPTDVPEALEMIRGIQGDIPIFGICLGHQLIALANGATTYKMKFGHRGANHPVKDVETGRVDFTSQNHGFAVDEESLVGTDLVVTHRELNDSTNEGLKHKTAPVFSVQYHPESAPGPSDANYLFDRFMQLMDSAKGGNDNA